MQIQQNRGKELIYSGRIREKFRIDKREDVTHCYSIARPSRIIKEWKVAHGDSRGGETTEMRNLRFHMSQVRSFLFEYYNTPRMS